MVTAPAEFILSCTSDRLWNAEDFVAFLNANQHGNIVLITHPEACCLKLLGVYNLLDKFEFESVTIKTWNPLAAHDKYRVQNHAHSFFLDRAIEISEDLQDWNLEHVFLCFYHRPTAARLALASYVQQFDSVVHFSASTDVNSRHNFELDKLFQWDLASSVRASNLLPKLPILQGASDRLTAFDGYDYSDPLTNLYQSCLVDVVVESHVSGQTFFPTEKTVRSMLMKKPFVMFASIDYLEYLRQQGFRTFSDFWSEEYDGYENGNRLRHIYKTIDYIASMNKEQLQSMWWDMKYSLDYNYNLLQEKKFQRKITPL